MFLDMSSNRFDELPRKYPVNSWPKMRRNLPMQIWSWSCLESSGKHVLENSIRYWSKMIFLWALVAPPLVYCKWRSLTLSPITYIWHLGVNYVLKYPFLKHIYAKRSIAFWSESIKDMIFLMWSALHNSSMSFHLLKKSSL